VPVASSASHSASLHRMTAPGAARSVSGAVLTGNPSTFITTALGIREHAH